MAGNLVPSLKLGFQRLFREMARLQVELDHAGAKALLRAVRRSKFHEVRLRRSQCVRNDRRRPRAGE